MEILHRRGESTVAEIMAELPDPPTYSAVRSILRILSEKKLIEYKEDGPRYVYYPAAPTEITRDDALEHVVRTNVYVTAPEHWEEVARAHGEAFRDVRPAATCVVTALLDPAWKVEIEVEATLP